MANPISDLLAKFSPMAQTFRQATEMARAVQSGNPLGMLNQNDPRMKSVNDFILSNGGNPEQAFYALARQKGVDPQETLNNVRNLFGIK